MIEALVIEGIVGSAGAVTLAAIASRPRPHRRSVPVLARAIARLPGRHRRRVRKIVAIAREHDARHPAEAPEAYTSRETLLRYLPETIDAYLAMPKALRTVRIDGARSADDDFVRQLRTLRAGLERVQAVDGRAAASRLNANGSFLDERFGPLDDVGSLEVASAARDLVRAAFAACDRDDALRATTITTRFARSRRPRPA